MRRISIFAHAIGRWPAHATLGLALLAPQLADAGVKLTASAATVAHPGDTAEICIALDSGGAAVAGTQNDLVWDGSCATLPSDASCEAVAVGGQTLFGKLVAFSDFTYRALILSLDDVEPIDDGDLYCCSFTAEAEAGQCCAIEITGAQAADPDGRALDTSESPGQLCVDAAGLDPAPTPTHTPEPTPTDCVQICGRTAGGGCQIDAPPGASSAALWLGGLALLILRRRSA